MPYLDPTILADPSAQKWKLAIKNALLQRQSAATLVRPFQTLGKTHSLSAGQVAKILLSFRAPEIGWDDILIFRYAKTLLRLRLTTSWHVLGALLDTSPLSRKPVPQGVGPPVNSNPTCEDLMFGAITQLYVSGELELRPMEVMPMTYILTRWMRATSNYETGKQLEGGDLRILDPYTFATYESVASLLITIFGSQAFRKATKQSWWLKRRDNVVAQMQSFDTHIMLWMQSQLAGRLQALTTIPPFIKTDAKGFPLFTDEQILGSITDLPTMNSRAGLFVWLNACLCARPLTDDLAIITYLQARFPANSQAMTTDLLIASFDVLTNSLIRSESETQIHLIRSFICNKIPHLLAILSTMLSAASSIEVCITLAFTAISIEAAPPITTGANDMREKLKTTRLEFLQACALHGLVTEATVTSIINEQASLPRTAKYTKEGLLAQCTNNIGRLEPFVDELDSMTGNASAIAGCLVDTINNLCITRDTMSLKTICAMLIKKTSTLDIVMQYWQPANLLVPLCNQLNDWTHDQDQTEFTPAYEEFASILLLVLVAVHRYDLSRADLGLPNDDNFMATLLQNMAVAQDPLKLSDEHHSQLIKWVEGLFATDDAGETGGISDEVMRHCPPQAFYQLVPTLFAQTILARKSEHLPFKTFNGGLELLVEPFLLPSLVGGLKWLSNHSWADHKDGLILLQALEKLLKPSSSSQETIVMHKAVLHIVADDLNNSLQTLRQRQPETKGLVSLIEVLKPYLGQRRTIHANKDQNTNWSSADNHGGSAGVVQSQIQGLMAWVDNGGPPPKYTHRKFAFGCATAGVECIRNTLVTEVKEQTKAGNGSQALDICSAMICAPIASLNPALAKVRDVLQLQAMDAQTLLKLPKATAEAAVRLSRTVESQLAVSQMPQVAMPLPMPDQATDQVMAELGLTDDALGANVTNDLAMDQVPQIDNAALDSVLEGALNVDGTAVQGMTDLPGGDGALSGDTQNIFGELGLDMNQDPQQLLGGDTTQNAEEDIFAGLDMNLGDDFNFS